MRSFLFAMAFCSFWSSDSSSLSSSKSVSNEGEPESVPSVVTVSLEKTSRRCVGGSRQEGPTASVLTVDSNLRRDGGDVCCLNDTVKPDGVTMVFPSTALMLTVRTWAAWSVSWSP